MNPEPNSPDVQSGSAQNTPNFSQSLPEAPVSALGSGAIAPTSPITLKEQPVGHNRSAMLQFITPKYIAIMIVAWLIIIAAVSLVVDIKPKANNSQANVPNPVALVTPLNPEELQKANINKLNDRLAEYYAKFGNYPATTQINSEQFRAGDPSFVKIGRKIYVDPYGTSIELATKPTRGQYHYMPTPVGCDSSRVICTGYTVGATLASGELYNLHNAQ